MAKPSDGQPKIAWRRRFARLIGKIAVAAVIAVWGVQEVWGESHWFTALLTYAPPALYLAIPAAALLVAALCFDLRAAGWALIAAGLCLLGLAQPSLHLPGASKPTGKTIRVVTWNVHDRLQDCDVLRAELERLRPDIVCLQEASSPRFRDCWPDAEWTHADSLLILTRGRITRHRTIELQPQKHHLRPLLEADVALDGEKFTVLNVHLYSYQLAAALKHPFAEHAREVAEGAVEMRTLQVEEALAWLERQNSRAIVAGDFNTPPRGRLYKRLARTATDSFRAAGTGFGWSFPRSRPVLRIDYIWVSRDLQPLGCRRLRGGPSDHRAVVADVGER